MSGTFGGDFNLADLSLTTKLKSLPILLFYLESKLILKSLSAKLNVYQSVFLPELPNLMPTKCITHTIIMSMMAMHNTYIIHTCIV